MNKNRNFMKYLFISASIILTVESTSVYQQCTSKEETTITAARVYTPTFSAIEGVVSPSAIEVTSQAIEENKSQQPTLVTVATASTIRKLQMYTTHIVNLRRKPTLKSKSLEILAPNTVVKATIYQRDTEWYKVKYRGKQGYINSNYLRPYNSNKHLKKLKLDYYHQDIVRDMINLFNLDVDEYLFYGMMYTETRFTDERENWATAQGILQITSSTWKTLYRDFLKRYPKYRDYIVNDSMDRTSNIILGIYYIKCIQDGYGYTSVAEHVSEILTSYNRGTYNTQQYYKNTGTYSSIYSQEIIRVAEYIRKHKTWKEEL